MVLKLYCLTVIFLRIHGQIRVSDEKAAVLQNFLKHSQWLTEFLRGLRHFES